jgi:hypothetical protein
MTNACPTCGRTPKRSNEANARYWVLLTEISEQMKLQGANDYAPDVWHEYFKTLFLGKEIVIDQETRWVPARSSRLTTSEFANYAMRVEAWAAQHGIYLEH